MQYRSLWALMALFAAAGLAQQTAAQTHVTGTVVDSSTGDPVPRATIRADGSYTGTAAGEDGQFSLQVPEGRDRLWIGAVGYATATRPIPAGRDTMQMTVQLAPRNVPLGHVTVTADRRAEEMTPSSFTLRPASIKQAPALGEPDVLRAAASLPGVAQPNDITSRLNVRGGSSDQNQFLLDGIEIYNPSHLFGLFGAFNPYVTGETTVHAASFPARHGGRLSSVIDVGTRVPRDSAYTRANVSLVSLSGAHAQEWGKTGVVVGMRRTYLDPVLAVTGGPEGSSVGYNFVDTNVKVSHDLTDQVSVTGIGFFQRDHLSVSGGEGPFDENESSSASNTTTKWGNALGALRLEGQHNRFQHKLTGSFVRTITNVELSALTLDNTLRDFTMQYEGALMKDETRLLFGGEWKRRTFDYGWSGKREELSNVLHGGFNTEGNVEIEFPTSLATYERRDLLAGHATVERRLLDERLTLRGGLRIDALSDGPAVWQPRVRASVQATSILSVHASAGRYAQYVATGFEGQEFNVTEPLFPLDRPQTAWTTTTGVTADLGERYRLRAVGYARAMDHFPRLREEGTPSSEAEGLPFRFGTARAYGLDLLAEKTRGWITGQLAYAFGHVRTEFGGERFPPSWSIPHSLRATLGLRLGKWEMQTSGHVHSGLPYTPVLGRILGVEELHQGTESRYVFGKKHSERLPTYARVDLALRRTYQADWFNWELYVQALNLFSRFNPLRVKPDMISLPIIPTVGVEFTF